MERFTANEIISLVASTPRYELGESVGPDLRLGELADTSELTDLPLAYGTAAGDVRLRRIIGDVHGVDPDDVVLTVGGMHALFLLAFILCDRGAEALIANPAFPLARTVLEAVGAKVALVPLSFDNGYRFDPGELRGKLSPRTRLVSLASPQNPSGVAIPLAVIQEIVETIERICPEAYLLIDETYREAAYGDNPVGATAVALGPKVVSVASLSKCHGAPGLRLGWATTRDAELRRQLILGKFNTVVSCSPVDEALALKVLGQPEGIIAARRRHLAHGYRRTAEWVRTNNDYVEWVPPDAGAICCIRLRAQRFDAAAIGRFHAAITRRGVRVANGEWFGDETRVFRLGFGLLPPAGLDAALDILAAGLREAAAKPERRQA
jgi:aspartate/methionine/tyrosine aminotransferase